MDHMQVINKMKKITFCLGKPTAVVKSSDPTSCSACETRIKLFAWCSGKLHQTETASYYYISMLLFSYKNDKKNLFTSESK
jgi:hypothetical protein